MKVIFLDIDGVLNTENYYDSLVCENLAYGEAINKVNDEFGHLFCPTAVKYLGALVKKHDAKIVISSSWRYSGLQFFRDMWKKRNLPGEVIGLTFCQAQGKEEFNKNLIELRKICSDSNVLRGHEIQAYLNCHPEITNYVIFDDDTDMLDSQKEHFVNCDGFYGITFKNYFEADGIFSDPDLNISN